MQPGETITPGKQPVVSEEPQQEVAAQAPISPAPVEIPQQPQAEDTAPPAPEQKLAPSADWQFSAEPSNSAEPNFGADAAPVSWTASEYIAHDKGASWFMALGVGVAILIGTIYFLTKDLVPAIVVGVAGLTFGAFAARPPKVLNFQVDSRGVQIGQKFYPYQMFKSFAILDDGPLPSILLMPLKRFLPPITVYYAPTEEDAILNVLADYLPHEEKEPDVVDRLMSRIRF